MSNLEDLPTAIRSESSAPAAKTSFELVVVEGPDRGVRVALAPGSRLLVGQSQSCDLRLTDRHVSRRHALIEASAGRVRITDLSSTNGTRIDSVVVNDAWLALGQMLLLGSSTLRLETPSRPAPPPMASSAEAFGRLVGASLEMRRLYPLCEKLAASDVPVIIEGETGTGKEVLAEALHEMGPRAAGPYVVFDCTTVPANLLESELFGHERGAFTGANAARKGVLEAAHGGTLLIDEIGDLDLSLQPKLLRAIERKEIRRVGSTKAIRVDVRILAATRRDLDHEVEQGTFRDDLLHRLAVGRIELPPLRRRAGDVQRLARHFWKEFGGAPEGPPAEQLQRWVAEPWPGNIRELRNAVARRIALGDVPMPVRSEGTSASRPRTGDFFEQVLAMRLSYPMARQRVAEEFEQRYLERVLAEHDGNVSHAAAASGIARRYFQRLRARRPR